jgi:hypothetical protein
MRLYGRHEEKSRLCANGVQWRGGGGFVPSFAPTLVRDAWINKSMNKPAHGCRRKVGSELSKWVALGHQ